MPPWVIAQAARSRIGACGVNGSTRALAGTATPSAAFAGTVATTCTDSEASASSAQATSRPSSWNSDDVVTSTIGSVTASSQAGGPAGGSQSHGPTMRTRGDQSVRGYSNGSAVR